MKLLCAHTRARKAVSRASSWHQGSGTHAETCQRLVEHFKKHKEVAELWADAATAEADHLQDTNGEWTDFKKWQRTESGKATRRAKIASRKVEPDFKIGKWM